MHRLGVETIATIVQVLIVLGACVIGAAGALLLKLESGNVSFRRLRLSPLMLGGIALYGVSTLLFIYALRGGELSILYPVTSTTYAWIAIFSFVFLRERIGALKIIGIGLIFAGVSVIGFFR